MIMVWMLPALVLVQLDRVCKYPSRKLLPSDIKFPEYQLIVIRTTEKRITLSVGDFLQLVFGEVVRFDIAFTHTILQSEGLRFLIVTETKEAEKDAVTAADLSIMNLKPSQRIIGLPSIESKRLYMVPMSSKLRQLQKSCVVREELQVHNNVSEVVVEQEEANCKNDDRIYGVIGISAFYNIDQLYWA
jgi:hypothetical protein